jgi:class 3 adenylate cyclase/tetratricopeptide (TPR) repeat protein
MRCPNCGQENPAGARFCFECGTPFEEASVREERKVVTVLFADLVGFTSRAEQLDPEDVRALLAPYHRRLRSELERFGGTVEKFIGDAVVALFGAPVAHEDDPERGVRAALAIRDWVREEEADLQLRIAVNTGEALIALGARPEVGEGMASGDVVNTTARLQSAAPVNGILVGETTWRATRDRIDYAEHDPVSAKGKSEPIAVWEAVQARSRVGMDLEQRVLTPLVGRERELGIVFDAFDRAVGQREPQLVTLVGVPGIGKSRLVAELFQRIEHMPELIWWRQGRALPYGSGVSFWAVGEMVKAQAGINENDQPEAALEKLHDSVAQAVDEHERAWVRRHLETLLGMSDEAALDRQETFAAWRRYVEGLAEQQPLVLVFEDLHWADDGLLDFVDHLSEWASGVPLLVLASARPELLDRRPNWGGGKLNAATLALSPLDDANAARVIAAVLDQTVLPADTQAALLEQAGGNPLYAEQFARLFLEHGRVEEMPVPENVQGIIASRLDALPEQEKQLLQDAAVLGKVFWSGGVTAPDAAAALHALERKGFIRRERRSAVAGQTEYAFRHVLVREVAYGQMPRAMRAEKHVAAVEWIESLGRPDDHAELIAYHYANALELLAATGAQPAPDLRERARSAFRRAGERATALNAFGPAADHYAAALALWPAEDPARPALEYEVARAEFVSGRNDGRAIAAIAERLLDTDVERAATAFSLASEAAWHRADPDETEQMLMRALDLVEPLPASEAKAWILSRASRNAMLASGTERALELGERALEMATELDLPEVRAHALNNMGAAQTGTAEAIALLEQSIELSARLNSPEECRAHHNLGVASYMVGDVGNALAHLELAVAGAERFGVRPLWRFSRTQLPGYYFRVGRWDEALELANRIVEEGEPAASDSVRLVRGWMGTFRGDLAQALEDTDEALAAARHMGSSQGLVPALAVTAFVRSQAGDAEAATALLSELAERWSMHETAYAAPADMVIVWLEHLGAELWRETYDKDDAPQTLWLAAGRALADADFAGAIELYGGSGGVTDAAAAGLYAARKLVAAGQRAEAYVYLRPALSFYRSVAAKRIVAEGEALLPATA